MISRQTIFSLLLVLLVGGAIFAWNNEKRDECDSYPASIRGQVRVVVGQSARADRTVPCSQWFPRQPVAMQALCLLEGAIVVVFAISAAVDFSKRGRAVR